MVNLLQSGVASAERVFELLDAQEEPVEQVAPLAPDGRGEVVFKRVSFRYETDRPLIETSPLSPDPVRPWRSSDPPGPGRPHWSTW